MRRAAPAAGGAGNGRIGVACSPAGEREAACAAASGTQRATGANAARRAQASGGPAAPSNELRPEGWDHGVALGVRGAFHSVDHWSGGVLGSGGGLDAVRFVDHLPDSVFRQGTRPPATSPSGTWLGGRGSGLNRLATGESVADPPPPSPHGHRAAGASEGAAPQPRGVGPVSRR